MKYTGYLMLAVLALFLFSFSPIKKKRKATLPAKNIVGHVRWIQQVPYHVIMDSAGVISKGSVISDTDKEPLSNMMHNMVREPIESWTYDEFGDESTNAKYHANGKLYNKETHIYFPNGDIREVVDSSISVNNTMASVEIKQYTYKYDSSENLLVANKWDYYTGSKNYPTFTRDVNQYDASGKKIESFIFNSDTVNPMSYTLYRYNDKGKLQETGESKREGNNPNFTPTEKYQYWYNEKGKLIDKAIYRFNQGLVKDEKITYDSSGKKVEIFSYAPHKVLTGTVVKSSFNLTHTEQEDTYDGDGLLTDYTISHFDAEKHLLDKGVFHISYKRRVGDDRKLHNTEPGDTVMVHHIINDEHFNIVEDDNFSNNGKTKSQKSYRYTYDNIGNWVEKIEFNNNNPIKIEEREIGYFKD